MTSVTPLARVWQWPKRFEQAARAFWEKGDRSPGADRRQAVSELLPPAHLVQAHRVFEAPQHVLAPVGEEKPLARAQPPDDIRGEDLSARGAPRDPRCHDHCSPKEVTCFL